MNINNYQINNAQGEYNKNNLNYNEKDKENKIKF